MSGLIKKWSWTDCRYRLSSFGSSFTGSGNIRPWGGGRPELRLAVGTSFHRARCTFTLLLTFFLCDCLISFLLFPCAWIGKHSCWSSTFPIAILKGTCSFARRNGPFFVRRFACKKRGEVFYGHEPPSGESTTIECGVNY